MSKKPYDPFQHEKIESHPSFCTVQFSRISGPGKSFFGSSVKSHSWIELRVFPATLHHDLGYDRVHSSLQPMIEVALSPAQFAELLTSMNVGSGVPGTLGSFDGKQIEQPTETGSETKRIAEHYQKILKAKRVEAKAEVAEILKEVEERQTFTKDLRKRIRTVLEALTTGSDASLPFYVEQFEEATARVTTQAKAEVDAFVTHVIQKTGLEALKASAPVLPGMSEAPRLTGEEGE